MAGYPISPRLDSSRSAGQDIYGKKETFAKETTAAVKAEVTINDDLFRDAYSTMYEVRKADVAGGQWKESSSGGLTAIPKGENQQYGRMDEYSTAKSEEPVVNALDTSRPYPITSTGQPPLKEEEKASIQPGVSVDTHAFLNFETMDDKKVKGEQQDEDERSSRAGSSEASTSSLKGESEEPETPARQPGLPISIAHLPVANKEVSWRREM